MDFSPGFTSSSVQLDKQLTSLVALKVHEQERENKLQEKEEEIQELISQCTLDSNICETALELSRKATTSSSTNQQGQQQQGGGGDGVVLWRCEEEEAEEKDEVLNLDDDDDDDEDEGEYQNNNYSNNYNYSYSGQQQQQQQGQGQQVVPQSPYGIPDEKFNRDVQEFFQEEKHRNASEQVMYRAGYINKRHALFAASGIPPDTREVEMWQESESFKIVQRYHQHLQTVIGLRSDQVRDRQAAHQLVQRQQQVSINRQRGAAAAGVGTTGGGPLVLQSKFTSASASGGGGGRPTTAGSSYSSASSSCSSYYSNSNANSQFPSRVTSAAPGRPPPVAASAATANSTGRYQYPSRPSSAFSTTTVNNMANNNDQRSSSRIGGTHLLEALSPSRKTSNQKQKQEEDNNNNREDEFDREGKPTSARRRAAAALEDEEERSVITRRILSPALVNQSKPATLDPKTLLVTFSVSPGELVEFEHSAEIISKIPAQVVSRSLSPQEALVFLWRIFCEAGCNGRATAACVCAIDRIFVAITTHTASRMLGAGEAQSKCAALLLRVLSDVLDRWQYLSPSAEEEVTGVFISNLLAWNRVPLLEKIDTTGFVVKRRWSGHTNALMQLQKLFHAKYAVQAGDALEKSKFKLQQELYKLVEVKLL